MDFALAQLTLLFLPGIIWANLDAKFGYGLKPQQYRLLINAFVFGVTTYFALFLIYTSLGFEFGDSGLSSKKLNLNFVSLRDEIFFSIPLSFALSLVWLWTVKNRFLSKFLHKIKVTNRYGDEDVWTYTFNSDTPNVEYVHIRDLENKFVYAGWVKLFSENELIREIVLRDAIVYDESGNIVSEAPILYLSRPKQNFWIEFPYSKKVRTDDKPKNR